MPEIKVLLWDIGGVLLSNAWDQNQRRAAIKHFALDWEEFDERHELVISSFERGHITLDQYLDRTIFYRSRHIERQALKDYIFTLSQPDPDALDLARQLAATYPMATINNESRELNLYRIERFGLRDLFRVFVSSCFVGLRKPEEGIYRLALELIQTPEEQCCFIDDRALNLECARKLGMHTIQSHNAHQLREELAKLGVEAPPASG